MADLQAKEYKGFEDIKYRYDDGTEYWLARELAPVLKYLRWENFQKVIDRAMLSCKNSGFDISEHFREVTKTIAMPKGASKKVREYELSRYACYLIVQNGDPRKEIIALGQTYFAIQTRRQEVQNYFNQLDEDNKRLVIRGDIKQWNQMLAETAHQAGVIDDIQFATFQNAGYMGLYGGETVQDIHARKKLNDKEKILDFMNSHELIANLFRISQAEDKIRKENIQGAEKAIEAHLVVGRNVRESIKKSGATLPEDQSTPVKGITEIERQQIKALKNKKLMMDE